MFTCCGLGGGDSYSRPSPGATAVCSSNVHDVMTEWI